MKKLVLLLAFVIFLFASCASSAVKETQDEEIQSRTASVQAADML